MFVLRKTLLHGRLPVPPAVAASRISSFFRSFSSNPGGEGGGAEWGSSWSTGITKDHFDGSASAVGRPSPSAPVSKELAAVRARDEWREILRDLNRDNKEGEAYVDSWNNRLRVRAPGYLEYSEKQEMYRLHKEDPATYTVERLAKDFRLKWHHVQAILWLEMKEEKESKQGKPLDDSVEILLDSCPENMADPKEKKGSKSYLAWTPEMDTALLTMLVEHHNNGDHAQNGWKPHVYNACIKHVKEQCDVVINKDKIQARIKTFDKHYEIISKMLAQSGFRWDWDNNMVMVDSDEVWTRYVEANKEAGRYRNKVIRNWDAIQTIYSKDHATGAGARTAAEFIEEDNGSRAGGLNTPEESLKVPQKKQRTGKAILCMMGQMRTSFDEALKTTEPLSMPKVTPPAEILDALKKVPELEDSDMIKAYQKLIINKRLFDAFMALPANFKKTYLLTLP